MVIVEKDKRDNLDFKHLDFECDLKTAADIKSKLDQLIVYINSPYLKDYNEYLQNKPNQATAKWSRHLFIKSRQIQ